MYRLKRLNKTRPYKTLTTIAVLSENRSRGIINVEAKMNFEKKVAMVDYHISFVECLFSDSSDMWMPRASEKASAMAIINMPLITTSFDLVPECRPTISPRVVIMAEVKPKLSPVFIGWRIIRA